MFLATSTIAVRFSTYQQFDSWMQRARKSTDYILPSEVCVMINVLFSSKTRATRVTMDAGEVRNLHRFVCLFYPKIYLHRLC